MAWGFSGWLLIVVVGGGTIKRGGRNCTGKNKEGIPWKCRSERKGEVVAWPWDISALGTVLPNAGDREIQQNVLQYHLPDRTDRV